MTSHLQQSIQYSRNQDRSTIVLKEERVASKKRLLWTTTKFQQLEQQIQFCRWILISCHSTERIKEVVCKWTRSSKVVVGIVMRYQDEDMRWFAKLSKIVKRAIRGAAAGGSYPFGKSNQRQPTFSSHHARNCGRRPHSFRILVFLCLLLKYLAEPYAASNLLSLLLHNIFPPYMLYFTSFSLTHFLVSCKMDSGALQGSSNPEWGRNGRSLSVGCPARARQHYPYYSIVVQYIFSIHSIQLFVLLRSSR